MSTVNLTETLIRVRDRQPQSFDQIEMELLNSGIRFVPPERAAGRTQVLPVILKAGVLLPSGVDFAIQAIYIITLFPAIRRVRLAIAAVLAALAIAAWERREGHAY